ncbi:hypothetical protein C1I60_21550 [Paenibacillus terrae]|uniref:Bacteriophage lysin domain-containing protein n=1 Tax=Paenibacillus terrae TaxID=159743 RepID=A0A4U2PUR4_9BACL|nr:peptidoglycan amidohydrolase family protein [Paenibacillus terrae]TKH41896.1 hypothetical protein C1I60_21550 [Paenibacillus terrae]
MQRKMLQSVMTHDSFSEDDMIIPDILPTDSLIGPYAEIGPTYPGTNVSMRIGDILYSTKTLGGSSKIVGHVGIVNSNFNVIHVTPGENGGVIDNLTAYMARYGKGETIKVYRPRDGRGVNAAKWVTNNYSRVNEYFINPFSKLSTTSPNYCSKFIWQAFYYGEGFDFVGTHSSADVIGFVIPAEVTISSNFVYITSFTAR